MFNDTSRYLDEIFTNDDPEFEKHIPDIYPTELQLNKANTSDKRNVFLGFKYKRFFLIIYSHNDITIVIQCYFRLNVITI